MLAHSVYDDGALLARRGNDLAARTHAESINAALAARVGKRVFGVTEPFVARVRTEHCTVDILGQVLNAHSDRKRLALDGISVGDEIFICVARTMPRGKYHRAAADVPAARVRRKRIVRKLGDALKAAAVEQRSAALLDAVEQPADDAAQKIGADVRL